MILEGFHIKDWIRSNKNDLKQYLLNGEYIICCSTNPSLPDEIIVENITRIVTGIPGVLNHPAIVEYGISEEPGSSKFRLHDGLTVPILSEDFVDRIVENMLDLFDSFFKDDGYVDRSVIYGKLGTEHQDEIVYCAESGEDT